MTITTSSSSNVKPRLAHARHTLRSSRGRRPGAPAGIEDDSWLTAFLPVSTRGVGAADAVDCILVHAGTRQK